MTQNLSNIVNGERVTHIEANTKRLTTQRGTHLEYDTLIWAAGGRPRSLTCSGATLAGVHSVRSRTDVDRMRAELENVSCVAIVGGGYIGLEAAAVLR